MDVRSIQDLRRFVDEIGKKLAASDKFFTSRLATRLTKAARQFPQDQTIIQMASFLSRRADNPGGHLISRAELKRAVNDLWTNDTQCRAFLQQELGDNPNEMVGAKMAQAHHEKEGELVEDLYSKYADQRLVSELNAAFDKDAQYRPYDPTIAKQAENLCRKVLPGNPLVQAVDGREFAILCQATYETPRGQSNVLIPLEVVKGHALPPTTFLSQLGFQNLNKEALEQHIVTTAGRHFRVNASNLFETIHRAKFGASPELDNVERAVMMLKAKSETPAEHTPDGILYQEIDPAQNEVEIPESPEVQSFAAELNTTAGGAEFVFGKSAVETGKGIIGAMLKDFGYTNAQVRVANFNKDAIIYAVSVNGAGLKVPVRVAKKKGKFAVSRPTTILAGGAMDQFTRKGIMSALGSNDQVSAAAAMGYDLGNSQALIGEVEAACSAGDMKRAGDAVAALEASGDHSAFKYGFETYMNAISGVKKEASKPLPQMKTIKIGGNIVEATTGLPVDKVYMDEHGNVQPNYRKNLDKTDDGTAGGFLNAKVIMGL